MSMLYADEALLKSFWEESLSDGSMEEDYGRKQQTHCPVRGKCV